MLVPTDTTYRELLDRHGLKLARVELLASTFPQLPGWRIVRATYRAKRGPKVVADAFWKEASLNRTWDTNRDAILDEFARYAVEHVNRAARA